MGGVALLIITSAISEAAYIQQSMRNGNEAMRQCVAHRIEIDSIKKCSDEIKHNEALFMQETRDNFKYIREDLQENKEILKTLIQKI